MTISQEGPATEAVTQAAPAAALDGHQILPGWRRHPGVRSGEQLSLGERAADKMRNGLGSWAFVFVSLIFLAVWMIGNRNTGFDKYPFILLNLVLSCLAAMQGAILLIAAKRADQISAELAKHDYDTDVEARDLLKQLQSLTEQVHRLTEEVHHRIVTTE